VTLTPLPGPVALEFTHRGDYPGETRPVITVEFAAKDSRGVLLGAYRTGVLVDSGARTTLLSFSVGSSLGLDLSDAIYPKRRIGGIVPGAGLYCAEAEIMVELCGRWLQIPAHFSLSPDPVRNLLGREGVFDRVRFAFGHAERVLYGAL
jgi:hypothetical protein